MELTLLGTDFLEIDDLDEFDSVIWADKYYGCGDFEINAVANSVIIGLLVEDRYLRLKESDKLMIIEEPWVHSESEVGDKLIVKGRSLESILYRRILWGLTVLTGNFQNAILQLLNENAINPTLPERTIDNLIFEASTDPRITSLTVDKQFTGDYLYDAIDILCKEKGVGFKITLNESNQFVFKLYMGDDRSYDQSVNPFIVFSPENDNIITSDYKKSNTNYKTVTLVAGEGEGIERTMIAVSYDGVPNSGLARRELFTDARDLTRNVDGGTLTDEQYIAQLAQRGAENLADHPIDESFEGELNPADLVYRVDFELGDIVQVADEYGHETKSRVLEYIYFQDSSGTKAYPTFETIV